MRPSPGHPRVVERSSGETKNLAQVPVRENPDGGRPAQVPGSRVPDLVHLSPGAVLKSLAEVLRAPSGLSAPIAPHRLDGPIAGLRRVVPAGSRLPWPAGRWGHEGLGVRGEVWAKFRGRPSAPDQRQRLPFSSFLPAQVVSGCGLPGCPASSLPARAPAHLLRPVPPSAMPSPPRKLLPSGQNPEKEHREVLVLSFTQVALSPEAQLFLAAL